MLRSPTLSLLCSTVLLGTLLSGTLLIGPAQAAAPSKSRWVADTYRAMDGSRAYVDRRVARGGHRLAVNLDIDNTSLASHYDYGEAVAVTLRFARHARAHGVKLLFNTGRVRGGGRLDQAVGQLRSAGFVVTEICGRASSGEGLAHSKQRCRRHFAAQGWTIIANVGNRSTDFAGDGYEKAFRLPNYHNQLA